MKATALFLAVSLLFEILTPYITLLAQELPEKQTEQIVQANAESRSWRKQVSSRGPALAVAERAIRLFYQMDVALMSRPNMKLSLLEKRLSARVCNLHFIGYEEHLYRPDQREISGGHLDKIRRHNPEKNTYKVRRN